MTRLWVAPLVTILLSIPRATDAHPAPFSYLDVHVGSSAVSVTAVVHVFDVAHDLGLQPPERFLDPAVLETHAAAIVRLLQDRMRIEADGRLLPGGTWSRPESLPDRQALRIRADFETRGAGRIKVAAFLFPYDPQHQTFLNIYEDGALVSQAILGVSQIAFEHFTGSTQGILAVIQRFVPAGIHHILIGPDHILFLVGLLLLGGSLKQVLMVVTAFTLAHSATLSLAALNLLNPPARLVEPAIALSIVYVGADNLTVRGGRDMRVWIAFAFGFIHGFGFASVLREMGVPGRSLGWSLFSFNLGVEVGQLLVVTVVASALALLRLRSQEVGRRLAVIGSLGVIAAGTFWFVQRVFFSGGTT